MKMRILAPLPLLAAAALLTPLSRAQVPVFDITQQGSAVGFNVKASVTIAGKFEKWDSTLTFNSSDVTTGVLSVSGCEQAIQEVVRDHAAAGMVLRRKRSSCALMPVITQNDLAS